ncbi:hypothetical protein [Rhodoferax sp. TH121]|uniref:hypothetical protein n=1 Tax=Rhodoferax sp. TH121 TaxID=2022803 RepID=UPI00114053ED|nr:hypothetical protein [Rhodoferax sp. TH121]
MDKSELSPPPWPQVGRGLWTRWWGYLARWMVFGVVVSIFQPVDDGVEGLWQRLVVRVVLGLAFGLVAATVFTLAENTLNISRVKWKTGLLVVLTWAVVKALFVTVLALV